MSVAQAAYYVEPLVIFLGPDFVLDFNGSHFTAVCFHFVIFEADNLLRVGNVTLNPSVVVIGTLFSILKNKLLP